MDGVGFWVGGGGLVKWLGLFGTGVRDEVEGDGKGGGGMEEL